jgi:DNA (cytosine-5)-methyltransferase 1
VEIEAFIIENLVKQMEQGSLVAAPVWTDLKTFPAQFFRNKIHWIIGGYPCQPFSTAGQQKGIEDPRHLWPYIKELIKIIRPVGCFFENVANHLNIGYREVRRSLEEMGYTVKEGIFTAQEVGAPHRRERIFILAMDNANGSESRKRREDLRKMFELQKDKQSIFSTAVSTGTSKKLADTSESGLQKCERTESEQPNKTTIETKCRSEIIWPAGQGRFQYEWEEPRTIESGMGCTIDGYDFREDLLRMYGNGVVAAVAELAFDSLLQEYFEL